MSEPRYISPMLDGFSLGQPISDHSGVECYPAMRNDSEKRYIVKKISLPASQVQVAALLLTGVYRDAHAVNEYYNELAQGIRKEVRILEQLTGQRGFVAYQDCQIEPMEHGVGYEVHLLSRYRKSLERFIQRSPMTHLGALNLGIDLCAALAVSREAGWLYVDLKPENIYLFNDQEYRIGDLGFVSMDMLDYTSLPDRYRSIYTAPEVTDAYSTLNATMDTYALGLIMYQVYNDGKLPFADEDGRKAWLDKLAAGEAMEPPLCADSEMAEIISKACAYHPEDRWKTPSEMGHALISYMQRNGAEDVPIVPPTPEPEETEESGEPAEAKEPEDIQETVEDAAGDTAQAAEPAADEEPEAAPEAASEPEADPESPVEDDPNAAEELAEITEPEVPEDPSAAGDWIDLMDAFLAEEEAGETAEGDGPSLRELLSGTDEEPVSEEGVTADTATILTFANELIEHEAPAPVVVPEPIDIPIPEPIVLEEPEEESAQEEEPEAEAPAEASAPAGGKESSILRKKLLGTVAALALAIGLIFAAWYYHQNIYLQTIDSMTCDGTGTQVTVTVVTTMDESDLTVICKDTYGNTVPGTLDNGVVTFPDLVPGSQYIISLEAKGLHKLLGTTSVTYSTPAETKIIDLTAVTGQEAGSAILSFGVEGLDSAAWTLLCEAEGEEARSIPFEGHTVTVTDLTVGTEYAFTLTAAEEVLLVGETSVTHTASDLVLAQDLTVSDYTDGTMTFTWSAPEGIQVDRWFIRCCSTEGYDQLQEVTESQAVFSGITDGAAYTVEVTASGMTLSVRRDITADSAALSPVE